MVDSAPVETVKEIHERLQKLHKNGGKCPGCASEGDDKDTADSKGTNP